MRYCEFTGDGEHDFDEVGHKGACGYLGFIPASGQDMCMKHEKPIKRSLQGWRMCCDECDSPMQVKETDG